MKQWTTTEFKGSVSIAWEDVDQVERGVLQLSYIEAWGLLHALERLRDIPAFKEREPRQSRVELSKTAVTTRIHYNGRD